MEGPSGACTDTVQSCNTEPCQEVCEPGSCPSGCGFGGDPAYPDGCGGTLNCPATEPCCEPVGCPTECDFGGDPAYPDGCGGTLDCPATDPCSEPDPTCAAVGEHCSDDIPCCSSDNYCAGEGICKDRPDDQCKDVGGPCGSANECCPGLICDLQGGSENGKCSAPCVLEGCPTECGFAGDTSYPDGCGGTLDCPPTEPCCEPDYTCPTECDYIGGFIDNGCGEDVYCEPTEPCCIPDYTCPTECGFQGGMIDNGCGEDEYCEPTEPCPVDCEGYWNECVGECGTGTRTYYVTQEAMYGGAECEYPDGYTEDCDLDPCPIDCEGEWSECEGECGTTGVRTFTVTVEAQFGGQECEFDVGETEDCETDPCPEDCEGEWSECEGECGSTGVQVFTITKQAVAGGAECDFDDGEERECETDPCPIDCEGEWGSCSGPCGTVGVQTYTILVEAEFGGEECEYQDGTTRECENEDCPPPPPPPPPPPDTPIVPVTGAGGPTEELLIIPVTGVDLGLQLAGFQKLFLYMGLMLFGVTMVLEGVTKKFNF